MAQVGGSGAWRVKRWQTSALFGPRSVSVSAMTKDPRAGADLTDDALQDEIELVGDLVVAATASDGR